ncbi:thiopeptide-type bacteriocin biosynthesis protein [Micromonospora sp. WMMD1155]|uniref:thiopeptide-type bacteriocin biosynthesis protein n=1 Tax=Micromonospora sp. WMMD1155 TaxID=3016094 RepID=UPI00249C4407|nr:thiopeptide-type bacteriocin biosynthesis protein [Micromonospora sp. WMMD1155]WFE53029.1 thiopeptide-type bacteriocin biosynthesis protein [Micromonospora sp. WMMD1155]
MTITPLAASVLTVLAGAPLETVAATAAIDPADLADAVDAYHGAGRAALEEHADSHWYQVRVEFPDWQTAETVGATALGPRLDHLMDLGACDGWWFLRKHPCWRIRLMHARIDDVNQVLNDLTATGAVARWWPSRYEPETTAFGGAPGIQTVHDLFCADSRGVLTYLRQPQPALGRRELSLLLLGGLLHAAELDWFERGDVFARVAQMRPIGNTGDSRLAALTGSVRGLLAVAPDIDNPLFRAGGAVPFAAPWHDAYTAAGRELATAATAGTLTRGLRAVVSHIVIFHWNRLGLPARTQGILARAALEAFLPRS